MVHNTSVKLFLFALLLLSCAALLFAQEFYADKASLEKTFDSILNSDEKLSQFGITSIVLSIVHNNKILFEKGYGFADPFKKIEANPSTTIYNIGSITKTFTGTAALQLVEQGKLSVNSTVKSIIGPGIVSEEILGNEVGDSYSHLPRRAAKQDITVLNLMTHTAGFDEALGLSAPSAEQRPPLKQFLEENMPPRIIEPNQVISYSNMGIGLLSHVLETVVAGGKDTITIGDMIRNKIFAPLNMNNSYFDFSKEIEDNPNYAKAAIRTPDGYQLVKQYGPYISIPAAGAIWSTASDMSQYAIAHLNKGYSPVTNQKILTTDSADFMYSTQFTMKSQLPGIGVIWFKNKLYQFDYIHHSGALPPFFSTLAIFHSHNCSVNVNLVGTGTSVFTVLLQRFVAASFYPPTPSSNGTTHCAGSNQVYNHLTGDCLDLVAIESIKAPADADTRWSQYTGCYKATRYVHTTWFKFAMSFFLLPMCYSRNGNYIRQTFPIITGTSDSPVLVEVEKNVFKLGTVYNGDKIAFSQASPVHVSFLFQSKLHEDEGAHATFAAFNQQSMEYSVTNFAMVIATSVLSSLLLLLCILTGISCCACGCVDLYFFKKIFCPPEDEPTATYNFISDEFNGSAADDDDELMYLASPRKRHKKREICIDFNKARVFALFTSCTALIGFILVTVFNLSHMVSLISWLLYLQKNSTFVLPQNSPQTIFILTLPLLSTVAMAVLVVCVISAVVFRCLLRQHMCNAITVFMAICLLPICIVNLTYYGLIGYFNIYGPFFLK